MAVLVLLSGVLLFPGCKDEKSEFIMKIDSASPPTRYGAPFIEVSRVVYKKWANRVGKCHKIDEIVNFDY